MLFLVLLLVLVALGLLIASLATSMMALAWISAVVSGLAAVVLIVDAIRRRSRRRGTVEAEPAAATTRLRRELFDAEDTGTAEQPAEPVTAVTAVTGGTDATIAGVTAPAEETAVPTEPAEPARENADLVAADEPAIQRSSRQQTELVATLDDEVVVVDERPRYHMRNCRWLGNLPLLPLPVREALELGFTPCALCRPDTELARRHGEHPAAHQ